MRISAVREAASARGRVTTVKKRSASRDQEAERLRAHVRVLEDQLKLMDERFIELRSRLDRTRVQSQREVCEQLRVLAWPRR